LQYKFCVFFVSLHKKTTCVPEKRGSDGSARSRGCGKIVLLYHFLFGWGPSRKGHKRAVIQSILIPANLSVRITSLLLGLSGAWRCDRPAVLRTHPEIGMWARLGFLRQIRTFPTNRSDIESACFVMSYLTLKIVDS
jgi:hypothetical protein